eukprot:SAG11_NODE_59_length_19156_cov_11.188750_3_plen_111_part_00
MLGGLSSAVFMLQSQWVFAQMEKNQTGDPSAEWRRPPLVQRVLRALPAAAALAMCALWYTWQLPIHGRLVPTLARLTRRSAGFGGRAVDLDGDGFTSLAEFQHEAQVQQP